MTAFYRFGQVDMSKLLEIELSRGCKLMLYDTELMDSLPEDVLAMGLKRGKAIQRRRTFDMREKQRECQKMRRQISVNNGKYG